MTATLNGGSPYLLGFTISFVTLVQPRPVSLDSPCPQVPERSDLDGRLGFRYVPLDRVRRCQAGSSAWSQAREAVSSNGRSEMIVTPFHLCPRLSAHPNHGGLARGRWLAAASACGLSAGGTWGRAGLASRLFPSCDPSSTPNPTTANNTSLPPRHRVATERQLRWPSLCQADRSDHSCPNGRPHTQVIVREHVQPPKREDQEHLCRPATDPLHLRELLNDPFVRQSPDLPKIDRPVIHLACQVGNVGCLLRRQTDRPEFGPR